MIISGACCARHRVALASCRRKAFHKKNSGPRFARTAVFYFSSRVAARAQQAAPMAVSDRARDGKLGKLFRLMLGSDRPGEIAAAAAAVNRELKAAGTDFHALADVVDRTPLIPHQTPSTPHNDTRAGRATRDWCASHDECLTPRELEFILDLGYWHGHPTKKQMDWLLLIERKIRARQARS